MSAELRILISAGEVSGDLYAAHLVQALHQAGGERTRLHIMAAAGERTRQAGAELLASTAHRAALGFVAPLRYLPASLLTAARLLRLVHAWKPHAIVLLDYPGFNIPFAGLLRRQVRGPVIYYLPPEECIWGRKGSRRVDRAQQVVRACDRLLTTHDTDTDFYTAEGGQVTRVGHPLLDVFRETAPEARRVRDTLALLPASRRQELALVWPALAEAAALMLERRPGLRFLIPQAAAHLRPALRGAMLRAERRHPSLTGRLELVAATRQDPQPALAVARRVDAAISKSGSVTLELALAGVPQLVVFRIDRISEWIGRHFLHLSEEDFPHMALPSFILGRRLVPEFLQHEVKPDRLAQQALALLDPHSSARAEQLAGYAELRSVLGGPGAARRGAEIILAMARERAA